MITEERNEVGAGGPPPPPGREPQLPWWRSWPPPFGRPQPINRRNVLIGGVIVSGALLLLDGFLAVMAGLAAGSWAVGAAVFAGLFLFNWLEFALVAWAAGRRQEQEKRRARG